MSVLIDCLKGVKDMDLSILAEAGMTVPELDYRGVLDAEDYAHPESLSGYITECENQMDKYARLINQEDVPHWRRRACVFRYEMARGELLAIYKYLTEFTTPAERPMVKQILRDHLRPKGHIITSELVEELEEDALEAGFIESVPPKFSKPVSFDVRCGPESPEELELQKRSNAIDDLIIWGLVGF